MILLIALWTDEKILELGDKVNILSPSFIQSVDVDNKGNVFISLLSSYTNPYLEVYFAKIKSNGYLEYFRNVSKAGSVYSLWAGFSNLIFTDSCIYVFWDDRRISYNDMNFQNEIFIRKYYQNISGGIWSGVENITENDGNWSINPSALLYKNRIHIVWQDTRNGHSEVFYKYFQNGIWSNDISIAESDIYSGSPSISIYHDSIFVIFEDVYKGNIIIRCKNILNGSSFILSDTTIFSFNPISDYYSGKIGILWNQIIDGDFYLTYREFDGIWKEKEIIKVASSLIDFDLDMKNYKSIVWTENGDVFYIDENLNEPLKLNIYSYYCSNPLIKKDIDGNMFIFWNGYTLGYPDKKVFYRIFKNENDKDITGNSYIVGGKLIINSDAQKYTILSIDGRKINEEMINNGIIDFDFKNYPQGIYLLILEKEREIIKSKIINIKK